mgnify:CR=1 FL=1
MSSFSLDTLISKSGVIDLSSFCTANVKAFYFSSKWCPACEKFTPILAELYNRINKGQDQKELEIIYVSDEASEQDFQDYYKSMPWLAVPFSNTRATEELQESYQITEIPALVIVNEYGEVLRMEGAEDVSKNRKKPLKLLQFWNELNSTSGNKISDLKAKEKRGALKKRCFFWF